MTGSDRYADLPDNALLWRRIPKAHVVDDGTRPSSAAFEPSPKDGKTSICVASMAGTPDEMMAGHEGFWLTEFTARDAREVGFGIELDENPPYAGHANLTWSGTRSARKRAQKSLAERCIDRWKIRGQQ